MCGDVIDLNVGGCFYSAHQSTLQSVGGSRLAEWFSKSPSEKLPQDKNGRIFIDRNGEIFYYVLEYLRNSKSALLPQTSAALDRLRIEAEYYKLPNLVSHIQETRKSLSSTITLSYRGHVPSGRENLADFQFRKITRILVSGKSLVCREVFGETLNESRAPDCGPDDNRYSNRYYLTHSTLELAFDKLLEAGFSLAGCCGETYTVSGTPRNKNMGDIDDSKCQFFHEFYFVRSK